MRTLISVRSGCILFLVSTAFCYMSWHHLVEVFPSKEWDGCGFNVMTFNKLSKTQQGRIPKFPLYGKISFRILAVMKWYRLADVGVLCDQWCTCVIDEALCMYAFICNVCIFTYFAYIVLFLFITYINSLIIY